MARRITILGMGMSAVERRLYIDQFCKGTEVWGLNNGYGFYGLLRESRGFTRYFELHKYNYLRTWSAGTTPDGQQIDHFAELQRLGCPIYCGEHLPAVTNQVHYPWEEVAAHHAVKGKFYTLGSPSLMLALALWEHDFGEEIEYIQSFGIDTDPGESTHAQQRASWAYWVAKAEERGIEIGGTATGFKDEPEHDEGLKGVREAIHGLLANSRKEGEVTDYAVASFCTDDPHYRPLMQRLKDQAKALGLEFVGTVIPVAEGQNPADAVKEASEATDLIADLLKKAGKPILYIDADDELLARPSFPVCDAGTFHNPEVEAIGSSLACAPYFYVAPTDAGRRFLALRQNLGVTQGVNRHRAMCGAWAVLAPPVKVEGTYVDLTQYGRKCIRFNTSPYGHRPQPLLS